MITKQLVHQYPLLLHTVATQFPVLLAPVLDQLGEQGEAHSQASNFDRIIPRFILMLNQ